MYSSFWQATFKQKHWFLLLVSITIGCYVLSFLYLPQLRTELNGVKAILVGLMFGVTMDWMITFHDLIFNLILRLDDAISSFYVKLFFYSVALVPGITILVMEANPFPYLHGLLAIFILQAIYMAMVAQCLHWRDNIVLPSASRLISRQLSWQ